MAELSPDFSRLDPDDRPPVGTAEQAITKTLQFVIDGAVDWYESWRSVDEGLGLPVDIEGQRQPRNWEQTAQMLSVMFPFRR